MGLSADLVRVFATQSTDLIHTLATQPTDLTRTLARVQSSQKNAVTATIPAHGTMPEVAVLSDEQLW